ncbi:MAG: hypothetical protein KatS3mg087_1196 [Patescibacteria group bacterium]|nr:MAG: hypothetical protein KatS3mg087_1196 [Patescibacteria group bacterium]
MARTTPALVSEILGSHYDGSSSLTSFIDTASAVVDQVESNDTKKKLTPAMLELIERWLAAHFYLHADQIASSESVGGASASYQGQTGFALMSTIYGQTAVVLDTTGYLSKLQQQSISGKRKVGVVWAGTRYTGDVSERAEDQIN